MREPSMLLPTWCGNLVVSFHEIFCVKTIRTRHGDLRTRAGVAPIRRPLRPPSHTKMFAGHMQSGNR